MWKLVGALATFTESGMPPCAPFYDGGLLTCAAALLARQCVRL